MVFVAGSAPAKLQGARELDNDPSSTKLDASSILEYSFSKRKTSEPSDANPKQTSTTGAVICSTEFVFGPYIRTSYLVLKLVHCYQISRFW
jgi:hypothetical protein